MEPAHRVLLEREENKSIEALRVGVIDRRDSLTCSTVSAHMPQQMVSLRSATTDSYLNSASASLKRAGGPYGKTSEPGLVDMALAGQVRRVTCAYGVRVF